MLLLRDRVRRRALVDSERAPLTREFGVPLYQQIQHLLRHRITTGEYPPGSKIPSESELCHELSVSRITVREALRHLVRARMVANPPLVMNDRGSVWTSC